jgi:3-oxoacyl-[acyl-carrier protein] reductase
MIGGLGMRLILLVLSFGAMDTLELGLKGKVAIVTGGSEGLGRAAVERLARSGVRVTACARRKDVLERAMDDVRKATGGEVVAVPADVSRAEGCEAVVAATLERFGGVDILLNNAGTSAAAGFEAVDDAAWQADFDLKVMAAIRLCRLVVPSMKQRGGGRIINVTNLGGKAPRAQGLPTSLSRAAGINLTKSLASEYAPHRILVNTICIGLVKSAQMAKRAKDGDVEAHYRELGKRVPIGRIAEASEFADLVAFLASERAAYITGTAINFDGGMSPVV